MPVTCEDNYGVDKPYDDLKVGSEIVDFFLVLTPNLLQVSEKRTGTLDDNSPSIPSTFTFLGSLDQWQQGLAPQSG